MERPIQGDAGFNTQIKTTYCCFNSGFAKFRHRDVENALLAPLSLKTNAASISILASHFLIPCIVSKKIFLGYLDIR